MSPESPRLTGWRATTAGVHLAAALGVGVVIGVATGPTLGPSTAALVAWVGAAVVFLVSSWAAIWGLDAEDTAWLAAREDGTRPIRDITLLIVSVGTLATVVSVIFRAHQNPPDRTALGVAAIAASWLVVNTVFTLRYARLYYSAPRGGLDFNGDDDPTFRDFAYVAFTIGMTFQVSDTALQKTQIRATALRHALMSFVFNTVILAVTVNIVAGLSG
jgi:uncharacterized membrane protein